MDTMTKFERARALYKPKLPPALRKGADVEVVEGERTSSVDDAKDIESLFRSIYGSPVITFRQADRQKLSRELHIGVIFSGGQAPGGHNVVAGLFDGLKSLNPANRLYGFLKGPDGLVNNKYLEITADMVDKFRNTGGFDMICSGRTKLEKHEQFEKLRVNCEALDISALVIIGGDDSNTNSCVLAEYFKSRRIPIQVIGCPKTIDGDLKNEWIETSFGFDTASRFYSGLIGNICRDAVSAGKYWHFIKLMGRAASHLTLECALQTHPNVTIISEEVRERGMSLRDIVGEVCNAVAARAAKGMNYGVVLVPEGLIEFIPEIGKLIGEMNDIFAARGAKLDSLDDIDKQSYMQRFLSRESADVFQNLPAKIRSQLCAERDPHGNVQVSVVETEKMIADMAATKLEDMMRLGRYNGSFHPAFHFFGYEGRCAAPTNYDANYAYSLGYNAAALINEGKTGYMSCIMNTTKSADEWVAAGVPLTAMMNMERRAGKEKPVIKKSLVNLDGKPFRCFAEHRNEWETGTHYVYCSSIQYFGPEEITDDINITLKMERGN